MALDYRQIANGAQAFYNVGIRFVDTKNHPVGVIAIPYYVNLAFSCELYMKALLVYFGTASTTVALRKTSHRLDKLFETLPNEVQAVIRAAIPDERIREVSEKQLQSCKIAFTSNLPTEVRKILETKARNLPSTFHEILVKNSDVFCEWRYFYEATDDQQISCDEWFLSEFSTNLHNYLVPIMTVQK